MKTYREKEVDVSESWLGTLFALELDMCLIGGWAVYETVTGNYEDDIGHSYIGSKDIDVGFHLDEKWSFEELEESDYRKFFRYLEEKQFEWVGFRFFKGYDYDTGDELTAKEVAEKPPFEVIKLYIDPIVDHIHPELKEKLMINPIDEKLLSNVFEADAYNTINLRAQTKIEVKIPKPEVLLSMKFNSVDKRTRDHKRIKDISDIFALIWYSDYELKEMKHKLSALKDISKVKQTIGKFTNEEIRKAADAIDFDDENMKQIFTRFANI